MAVNIDLFVYDNAPNMEKERDKCTQKRNFIEN